jgi:hypothetical protein
LGTVKTTKMSGGVDFQAMIAATMMDRMMGSETSMIAEKDAMFTQSQHSKLPRKFL